MVCGGVCWSIFLGETRAGSLLAVCQPPGLLQQLPYCLRVDLGVVGRPSSVFLEAPEYSVERGGFCLVFNWFHGCMSVVYGAHDGDYLVFEYSGPLGHVVLDPNKVSYVFWIQYILGPMASYFMKCEAFNEA